ncbi:MAG: O-antigen ligase family protein [Bacteroidales bacterium]|nr:O-antigen ligase family protein [Bacteroidales bacterium]
MSKAIKLNSKGLLTGALLSFVIVLPLLLCRYTNSFGSWVPVVAFTVTATVIAFVLVCKSGGFRINIADFLLIAYCLYALARLLFSKACYIEPLTLVKWLLLGLLYIIGRTSNKKLIPYLLITVGISGPLAYLFSFFFNPGHLGVYASIGVSGVLGLALEKKNGKSGKILLASLSIILLVILLISKSRGALLATLLAAAYLFFSSQGFKNLGINNKRMIYAGVAVIIIIGIVLLYKIRPESADVRLLIWSASGEAFLKSPLFGYSSGAVQSLYMPWQAAFFQTHPLSSLAPLATNHYQTFNEYLHLLCEQGIVGFVLFALYVVFAFKKSKNRSLNAASIALAISSYFLYTYDIIPIIVLVPLFLGLANNASAVNCLPKSNRSKTVVVISSVAVLVAISIVCWNVGKKYHSAEKELRCFIHLPEDIQADRISPSSEAVVFRNKDMTLLYATHSYKLSQSEHVAVLESCSNRIIVVEMMSSLGNLYSERSEIDKAESCFITAHYMAPDRIVPKYDLFKFYRDSGILEKAKEWAEIIIASSPRIYNAITLEIKAAARDFIKSQIK